MGILDKKVGIKINRPKNYDLKKKTTTEYYDLIFFFQADKKVEAFQTIECFKFELLQDTDTS